MSTPFDFSKYDHIMDLIPDEKWAGQRFQHVDNIQKVLNEGMLHTLQFLSECPEALSEHSAYYSENPYEIGLGIGISEIQPLNREGAVDAILHRLVATYGACHLQKIGQGEMVVITSLLDAMLNWAYSAEYQGDSLTFTMQETYEMLQEQGLIEEFDVSDGHPPTASIM
jgi:hypothetical protein